MITELVLLLGVLAFVCVRTDFVIRRTWFVLALMAWGAARILTEMNFTGTDYHYGNLLSYGAALSLVGCLLFLFIACLRPRQPQDSDQEENGARTDSAEPDDESPSERLEHLMEERG